VKLQHLKPNLVCLMVGQEVKEMKPVVSFAGMFELPDLLYEILVFLAQSPAICSPGTESVVINRGALEAAVSVGK